MLLTSSFAGLMDKLVAGFDYCPWSAHAGVSARCVAAGRAPAERLPIYTAAERRRRDSSPWTVVQGILAPLQFVVFLASLALVLRYLATGEGLAAANASIVVKTLVLYAIMITGSIWEREVFGRYLFARPFFWEDVFSILVLALHTGYLAALIAGALDPYGLMMLALAAYAAYVINAGQFLMKLRMARLEGRAAAENAPARPRAARWIAE